MKPFLNKILKKEEITTNWAIGRRMVRIIRRIMRDLDE